MKFSILVPAYKKEYLKECIESVLNQCYEDFEVIILNDASPHDLDSIIRAFSDQRIKYYTNERNIGAINVVDNWNKCLKLARGEYVICMGDDDILLPSCLSRYLESINQHKNYNVFHCRSYIIDENSQKISITPSWPLCESVYENMWHRIHHFREQFIGDFLYKREPLVENGGFYKIPLAWASDDISSFIAMNKIGIIHINEPLFGYRRTSLTLSSCGDIFSKLKAINAEEGWYHTFVSSSYPDNEQDKVIYESIKKELPHYFKIKRLNTVAYFGFQDGIFSNLVRWYRKRHLTKLTMKELIYAAILALKNKKSSFKR